MRGDLLGSAFGEDRGKVAGGVADELTTLVAHAVSLGAVVGEEDADVVHDRAIAGPGLDRLDPAILREPGFDTKALVIEYPVRDDGVGLRHRQHDVGRADRPALGE